MRKNTFTWSDAIEEVIRRNGNTATLKTLHEQAPPIYAEHNEIRGLTPHKTIDERVQRDKRFVKLVPGLYTLADTVSQLPASINPAKQTVQQRETLTHISMQALLLQIGQFYKYDTFTPDGTKSYVNSKLRDFATLSDFPKFTYDRVLRRTRNIDVSWFNQRGMPSRVFEIENSTDMKNGLSKFMELVDFKTKMFIVAPAKRENEFRNILQQPTFKPIETQVEFCNYEMVEKLFNSERDIFKLRDRLR